MTLRPSLRGRLSGSSGLFTVSAEPTKRPPGHRQFRSRELISGAKSKAADRSVRATRAFSLSQETGQYKERIYIRSSENLTLLPHHEEGATPSRSFQQSTNVAGTELGESSNAPEVDLYVQERKKR